MPTADKPADPIPNLTWLSGEVLAILFLDKERVYAASIDDGRTTHLVTFADPRTGKREALSADDPRFAVVERAFVSEQSVELGVRDFGLDPATGVRRIVIDRAAIIARKERAAS